MLFLLLAAVLVLVLALLPLLTPSSSQLMLLIVENILPHSCQHSLLDGAEWLMATPSISGILDCDRGQYRHKLRQIFHFYSTDTKTLEALVNQNHMARNREGLVSDTAEQRVLDERERRRRRKNFLDSCMSYHEVRDLLVQQQFAGQPDFKDHVPDGKDHLDASARKKAHELVFKQQTSLFGGGALVRLAPALHRRVLRLCC